MKKILFLLSVVLTVGCTSSHEKNPQLLLISFDGFRADYLLKTDTPNFDKLVKNGVTVS